MKNQRSPLEDLNAQRTRRAPSSLDGLNRTLEELESRLKGLDSVRAPAERSYYADEESIFPRPYRSDLHDEIGELKRTVQTLAREESLRRLTHRWDSLDERFDAFEQRHGHGDLNAPAFMRQMDERLDEISRAILSTSMSRRPDPNEARRLERIEERLADLTRQIEAAEERSVMPDPTFIREIDRRFEELAQRLDDHYTGSLHDARLIESLEGRLEDISQQLSVNAAAQSAMHTSFPGHEVFRNLEAQVAEIARHLAKPDPRMPVLEQRLDSIERSLKSSRDTMLDAARQAAEDAIRHVVKNGSSGDAAIARQLAEDLKSLEALTRRTDERSSRTFETIHDTLIKIVDRLGRLEEEVAKPGSAPIELPRKSAVSTAPLPFESETQAMPRSPAAAAAEAALAALKSDGRAAPKASEREGRKSMFGGLAKAVKGRSNGDVKAETAKGAQKAEPGFDSMTKMDAIAEPLDEADIKLANQPLEPGSGMPDLNTILKRVRDERRERGGEAPGDAGKADYIIAARRAAQAAAAESERLKKTAEKPQAKKRAASGGVLQRQRKPILMAIAAIMIAMAGLQVGTAFLARDDRQGDFGDAANVTEAPAAAPSLDTRSTAAVPEKQPDAEPRAVTPETPAEQPAPSAPADTVMLNTRAATAAPEPAEPAPQAEATAPVPETSAPAQADTGSQQAAIPEIPEEAGPQALREAAANGDPKALFEIGNRYTDGRGVQSDYAKAAQWYELAASKGFAPAQYRLGNFNEKGLGMPRDTAKARDWYQKAAEQGNASAMHNLAVLYAMGPDGTPDNNNAVRWFIKAAELGVKDSQFNLGILAAKGLGMPQNLEESYKWFALAAQSGDKDAEQKRDAIAGSLKPEQLERAKGMVSLWKAKPLNEAANSVDVPDAWLESQPMTTGTVDMKKAVRNIQLILSRSGYDAGTPDGVMGAKTRQAIAAFQKANGMKPTGDVDQPLVEALLKQNQQLSMAAKQ
ncbi:peptidoglycan-binding protein [Brucella sp. IR073]|uniref:peptidoglycan-binding protein n=1 Tax=unclassified Brucella TaxID=2632610 RepID=UPI003B986445